MSKLGVGEGDVVMIYLPMIPQAVITMLATVRLGAAHALVFGGFAARELAVRINHCKPKLLLTANFGIERTKLIKYVPTLVVSDISTCFNRF